MKLLVTLIFLLSSVFTAITIFHLIKKNQLKPLFSSAIYALFSSIVFSIIIGTLSVLLFLIYHIDLKEPRRAINWVQGNLEGFFLSVFLLTLLTFALILLIGEVFLGAGVACSMFFLLALTNYYKMLYRNEPLFPNDFIQIGQIRSILPMIDTTISMPLTVVAFVVLLGLLILWYYSRKIKVSFVTRIILLLPVLFLIGSFLFYEEKFAKSIMMNMLHLPHGIR